MASKFGIWWQKIKQHSFIAIGITALLIALLAFVLAVRWLGWDWTGFTGYSPPAPQYQRGKTLWDWLQLLTALAIPIVVGFGAAWFTAKQTQASEARNKQQHETELQITTDNQREVALQVYIDKISELLLASDLRVSTEDNEVRNIARVRTLTVLRGLDPTRKASVIRFLHESGLIDKDKRIIRLSSANLLGANLFKANLSEADLSETNLSKAYLWGADLSRAKLLGAYLSEANLSRANLSEAKLSWANLWGADLSEANLSKADLWGANLSEANLREAYLSDADLLETNLSRANLSWANLSRANLSRADLSEANLSNAIVTKEQLEKAKPLKGATKPDSSKHP